MKNLLSTLGLIGSLAVAPLVRAGIVETNSYAESEITGISDVSDHMRIIYKAPASSNSVSYIFQRATDLIEGDWGDGKNYAGEIVVSPTSKVTVIQGYEPQNDGGTNYNFFRVKGEVVEEENEN